MSSPGQLQLLPPLHPILQYPLTSPQCCQCSQQALLELISFRGTLKCEPELAVAQAPVMEDGVDLVVNQARPQGTLQGGLRGQEGGRSDPPLPDRPVSSS